MPNDIVFAKLSLLLPKEKFLYQLSREFAEINIKIISMMPLEEKIGNVLIEIQAPYIKKVMERLNNLKSAKDQKITILHRTLDSILLNFQSKDALILNNIIKSRVVIQYPIIIKNGVANLELISDRSRIDNLLTNLEYKNINSEIRSIGYKFKNRFSDKMDVFLTQRQETILKLALSKGFFEIPRKTSMKQLAKTLNISTSALSENIRRISKKLGQMYIKKII